MTLTFLLHRQLIIIIIRAIISSRYWESGGLLKRLPTIHKARLTTILSSGLDNYDLTEFWASWWAEQESILNCSRLIAKGSSDLYQIYALAQIIVMFCPLSPFYANIFPGVYFSVVSNLSQAFKTLVTSNFKTYNQFKFWYNINPCYWSRRTVRTVRTRTLGTK